MGTQRAYTLSELLVAIAILGLLATFAIPKLLQDVQTQQNKAKFKEAIALIERIGFEAYQEGGNDNTVRWDYFLSRMNVVKVCDTNGSTQGCNASSITNLSGQTINAAVVLANGTVIGGILRVETDNNKFSQNDYWFIDVNGLSGPNTLGQDVIWVTSPRFSGTTFLQCGARRLVCTTEPISDALYRTLF